MNRHPGIVTWAILGLVALLLAIPVTFGPAVWLQARYKFKRTRVEKIYGPVLWAAVYGPEPVTATIHWWGDLGVPPGEAVLFVVPSSNGGESFVRFGGHLGL